MLSSRLSRLSRQVAFWTALTALTAGISRWASNAVEAYPRARESGPAAACDPAAARDEQRLADSPLWRFIEQRLAARALKPFRVQPGFRPLRILNVDFGPGGVAIALRTLAPLDATVVATDPVTGMGDLARHRAARRNPRRRPRFLQAWGYRLPFQDTSFDLVVAAGALHGWPDAEAALAEIRRVLRPDGRYVIADLRRDVRLPLWLGMSLLQAFFVPKDLRALGEPGSSVRAAYAPHEAEWLAARAKLPDLRISVSPAWILIERGQAASPAS